MSNMPKDFYNKKYIFDVVYEIPHYSNPHVYDRIGEIITVFENHSKFAYAKCATNIYKRHRFIKEIISIELLHSEPNN